MSQLDCYIHLRIALLACGMWSPTNRHSLERSCSCEHQRVLLLITYFLMTKRFTTARSSPTSRSGLEAPPLPENRCRPSSLSALHVQSLGRGDCLGTGAHASWEDCYLLQLLRKCSPPALCTCHLHHPEMNIGHTSGNQMNDVL